ncbi:hypothetical protein HanXRQr2_Chr05g0227391 [Helianthus annuus]|uniref:Uncharacterized protein n=1 Tax=Helianthus annuus TaxID=4232 RepID=A0A9K3J229_HELAN|nr:hypothetical protein HanXRQr2_Chr05g0227391 [Helianthus annuus]KAJ0923725.1 hypothetical protein HanPSC8_Chr05g0219411 [Helianthus annuus]
MTFQFFYGDDSRRLLLATGRPFESPVVLRRLTVTGCNKIVLLFLSSYKFELFLRFPV